MRKKVLRALSQMVALLLLLLSPLFPVAAPPGDVVGRSSRFCCSLLLLGVDLFATIISQHSVLLHRRSERTATLRSSPRPHKTLIPGPNPHRGPKARRNIEVTNSRLWGVLVISDPGLNSGIEILVLGV